MAISHLCTTCGTDLSRVRAPLDPHYALPVVVCPSCATAVVRRVHPLRRFHRASIRLGTTLGALGLQVGAALAFTAMVSAICMQIGERPLERLLHANHPGEVLGLIMALGVLPIALGTWLTAGLAHWPRTVAWVVFTGVVALLLATDTIIGPLIERATRRLDLFHESTIFEPARWIMRLRLLAIMMLVAAAGIPAGRLLLTFVDHLRRAIRGVNRRRARLRSTVR